ncbi:MAG: IS110 family transposase [Ardenticatenia bacterium]|nr:IS110 family transposase [Ardenticatenia bacterium]
MFKERGFEVIVANPRQVRLIAASQRKTDRYDAQMLARLGRLDPALLAPVQHRGVEAQQHRAMMQARDGLVRCRTLLINQVRGLTKALGYGCRAAGRVPLRATLGDKPFLGVDTLLSTIEQLSSDIRAMDKQVKELIESTYPEAAHLQQVSGVGPITSLWYILTLEDPSRFAKSRVVGAYLGLCPGQRSSGEQRPQLGISKAGDETLRRYLCKLPTVFWGHWVRTAT